jgi:hypothetical protein
MRELNFCRPEKTKQERMREYNKKYRDEHSEIVECKCGAKFKEISKYTHYKTTRHQDYLVKLSETIKSVDELEATAGGVFAGRRVNERGTGDGSNVEPSS